MAKIGLDTGHDKNTFPPSKGVYRNGKGYAEYDFNRKLASKIKRLLEHNGHTVITHPHGASLTARTNLYNREKVDIVISVHANAGVPTASGRCVFYWGTSKNGKRLATAIRDEIKNAGYSTHGNGLHASELGSWTNLHITRETHMPAVLIEHGFMTNNADFELIFGKLQNEYIEAMAIANVKGIQNYFKLPFKSLGGTKKMSTTVKIQTGGLSNDNLIKVIDYFRERKWYGEVVIHWEHGNPKVTSGGLTAKMQSDYEAWLDEQGFWYKVL